MSPLFRRLLFVFVGLLAGWAGFAPSAASAADDLPPVNPSEKPNFIYRLTVTDRIRITIFQEDDLTEIARVDARGNVNLKLVGDLHVAGLTISEAQKAIEDAYRDGRYLRNPQANVSVEDYAPREVSIQGQVKAPGRYLLPVESTFSILDLVTKAGGLTDIAKATAVVITRIGPDGKKTTFTVDVDGLIRGKKSAKSADNLLLEPGDIVYVPESII
jgi:polysaccharide export outer membrane protein